jgi:hypothetical protein
MHLIWSDIGNGLSFEFDGLEVYPRTLLFPHLLDMYSGEPVGIAIGLASKRVMFNQDSIITSNNLKYDLFILSGLSYGKRAS